MHKLPAAVLFVALTGCVKHDESPRSALGRACSYLWGRQAADGGWHSETYGLLRSGQAYTPFILDALSQASSDTCAPPPGGVEKALDFILGQVSAEGVLGVGDPEVLEYPNYSTAYALLALVRARNASDRALIERMRSYLASEQYGKEVGFEEDSPAFGGWGFGGKHPRGITGHMDLAHTRRALEALRTSGHDDPEMYRRALVFLGFMQRHPKDPRAQPRPLARLERLPRGVRFDGGFYFSPVVLDANKGAVLEDDAGPFYASYASATCDGVLALLAAGAPPADERVRAAREWLERHARLDFPEGIPADDPDAWGDAIYFYHLAARAEAYAALGVTGDWPSLLERELAGRQREDGSFINLQNHLMKEDDPLLATALSVVALGRARSRLGS